MAGMGRRGYTFRAGGTALANAWRTVRRCPGWSSDSSRIDRPSTRLSRLISSKISTLDRTISDPHADDTDVTITRGGARIRDD
jgi:hypothetical protein